MAKLEYLIVHCSDTPEGREVSKQDIENWHTKPKPKGRGWHRLGYSDMIHIDGSLENLTHYNEDNYISNDEMTWGAAGINAKSRHVVVVGGRAKNNKNIEFDFLTPLQARAIIEYCRAFIRKHPTCKIAGHYHFSKYKTCPNFDIESLMLANGIPSENIFTSNKTTPFDVVIKG